MPFKTYVLLDSMNVTVPIYQRVNKEQRVPIVKRNGYAPFLQLTVQDENGVSHNIRYKEACPTIFMDEQIEKYKIAANAKYSNTERSDRFFRNGINTTNKVSMQKWLETYPGFDKSTYTSEDVPMKQYTLFDKGNINKIQNAETKLRLRAANKVAELELSGAQAMLIRLNGSFFKTPSPADFTGTTEEKEASALEECQNMLFEFVDAAEEKGLKAVLQEEEQTNIDDKTTVLIGKLINAGKLSFDAVEGTISKKDKNGEWIKVRDMSAEYSLDERKRLFSDFLNTKDGKPLKEDLEKDLSEDEDEGDVAETKKRGRKPNN
jgi:hypothetical protein